MKICPTCQNCFEDADAVCPDDQTLLTASHPGPRLIGQKYALDQLLRYDEVEAEFAATRVQTEQPVAIKLLPPSAIGEAEALKGFRREANAVAHLNTRFEHQHVVKTLDYGVLPDGGAYIVTELIAGESLRDYVASHQPLSVAAAARIARQVAGGLGAAHRSGVVHGDLNPSNIVVTRDHRDRPEAKVFDFGFTKLREHLLAKLHPGNSARPPQFDFTPYAAPERRAGQHLDARADVYSLGVIIFEMLAGRLPFEVGGSAEAPPSLRDFNSDVPEPLAQLIAAALRPKALARISSANELARGLRPFESANGHVAPMPEEIPVAEVSSAPPTAAEASRGMMVDDALDFPRAEFPAFAPAAGFLPPDYQPEIVVTNEHQDKSVRRDDEAQIDDGFRELPDAATADSLLSYHFLPADEASLAKETPEVSRFNSSPTPGFEATEAEEFFRDHFSPSSTSPAATTNGHPRVRVRPYVETPRYQQRRRPVFAYVVCAAAIILGCIGGGVLALRLVPSSPARPDSRTAETSWDARPPQQLASLIEFAPTAADSPVPENSPPVVTTSPTETATDLLKREEALREALTAATPEKSPLPAPPPLAMTPNAAGNLGVEGKPAGVSSDAPPLDPAVLPAPNIEARPSPTASPAKAAAATKAAAEGDVRCGLSVSRETVEVGRDGGAGSVTATLGNAAGGGLSASTPDWADIVVFSEPQGADGRVRYSVKSVSKKTGTYRLQLKSRCGSKSVAVHVR